MNLPLFTLFTLPAQAQLWSALKAAEPARAWQWMNDLADLDLPLYEASVEVEQRAEHFARRAFDFMSQAPAIESDQAGDASRRFGTYGPRLQLESSFLTLALDDPRRLFGGVVAVEGTGHLKSCLDRNLGVLALPLHFGPSYAIPPLLAHFASTRFAFNRMNFDALKQLAFPRLDVEAFDVNDDATFLRGFRALRERRIFALFPELDPRGQDKNHERVPFLGTSVVAPQGPVVLSRLSRAPMLPVVLDSLHDGTFHLRFLEPLEPPESPSDDSAVLRALWKAIERELLDGRVGDWEMWVEFDLMRPEEPSWAA